MSTVNGVNSSFDGDSYDRGWHDAIAWMTEMLGKKDSRRLRDAKRRRFDDTDVLKLDIRELGLALRARNALSYEKITTIGDLIKWRSCDILDIQNVGPITLQAIDEALAEYGLSLRKG